MFRVLLVFALALLAACDAPLAPSSPTAPTATRNPYSSYSSTQLWGMQGTTSLASELRLAEAELGARGESSYGTWYIGQRTASEVGTTRYSRATSAGGGKDCGDFKSAAEAQGYFLLNGGSSNDPHNLDGN